MIHDNTPHRIFKISELTRLIASQLVLIDQKGTANLARACRCLEEPALSVLWETQWSLYTLLEVLPEENLEPHRIAASTRVIEIVGDPSLEAWNRVWRYASWMRQVTMDERTVLVGDTFFKFRLSSPVGGWFPALQVLSWRITESNLLYIDLFLSPYLKKISIYTPWLWNGPEIPHDTLTVIASTISALPTSVLQSLSVDVSYGIPSAHFTDSLSSVVLRCGLSLTAFTSIVPLSDAAVDHLIRLPHLHTWHIEGPPPSYSTSSLPIVFPPLTEFTIGGGAPGEWISLFRRLEADISTTRGMAPLSRLKNSLKLLNIRLGLSDLVLDVSFTSLIQIFRNLIFLRVRIHCPDQDGEGRCAFRLSDDDVTKLTMALPQLEHLSLGRPCLKNTCATTVACLFQTSVHCVKLRILEIHFNTTTIVGDLKNISRNPRFQGIRSLPKCRVSHMYVDQIPLVLDEPDLETVVNGMVDIFPSLNHCFGLGRVWSRISERITELRESQRIVVQRTSPPSLSLAH